MTKKAPRRETAILMAAARSDKDGGGTQAAVFGGFPCKICRPSDSRTGHWVRDDSPAAAVLPDQVVSSLRPLCDLLKRHNRHIPPAKYELGLLGKEGVCFEGAFP